ncbi:MAG TPA: hypothetical protein VN088_03840 [Nocardioides sp.]|nr:hypothetical protein [Nocardioides sp.]
MLLGIVVVALAVSVIAVVRQDGGSLSAKIDSLRHPGAAVDSATLAREQALGVGQDFVTRFNTYGPQMLAKDGTMPAYETLSQEMTSKFAAVFAKNVGIAEAIVKQNRIRRSATVYGAGVSDIDSDTATVIVAGVARFAYPNPKQKGGWLPFNPERFRYAVSLVKQDGRWLVDDLDDIDDGLPPLGESGGTTGGAGSLPTPAPSLSGSKTGSGS